MLLSWAVTRLQQQSQLPELDALPDMAAEALETYSKKTVTLLTVLFLIFALSPEGGELHFPKWRKGHKLEEGFK